jgi:uncharacterized protein (DUF3084 family)
MTTDRQLHEQIDALIGEEHQLRASGHGLDADQQDRLRHLEEHLDTLWDLLRRRDAARSAGINLDDVKEASVQQVEGYIQ